MYAGHLKLPCFFVQLLKWQEYQVSCLTPTETFSQVKVLTLQSSYGKDGLIFRYI